MPRTPPFSSDATQDTEVSATPTKRFFVEMLTRDIELADALLDLLDNCVDGVLRSARPGSHAERPYSGYFAEFTFNESEFRIRDNCGGISREIAEKYAFLMGRPDNDERDSDLPTVGMYGIGMKRAIFKMGRDAVVISHHASGSFEVSIPETWFRDTEWNLKAHGILPLSEKGGTEIVVRRLLPSVKHEFKKGSNFEADFKGRLRSHYAFIMHKGFSVKVNGQTVEPKPIRFLFRNAAVGEAALEPYLYDADIDGVHVQVTVGFCRALQGQDEAEAEMNAKRSSDDAGWTVICNDRVVLHSDKNRATGWGEADVPSFHAQFNAIAGVVEFRSTHAERLPLTTTKRGIEGGSELYLRVKNRMREGTKLFTQYTYKWKHALDAAREFEGNAEPVDISAVRGRIAPDRWKETREQGVSEKGKRFMPNLPTPAPDGSKDEVVIRFKRRVQDVRRVGSFLLDNVDAAAGDVGSAAFDEALKRAPK